MRVIPLPELTPDAERQLKSVGDLSIWSEVKADLVAGRSHLFSVNGDTFVIFMIDNTELVFVAAIGNDSESLMNLALEICRGNGLRSIRFHTMRRGLARLVKKFKPVECKYDFKYGYTYRVNVNEN